MDCDYVPECDMVYADMTTSKEGRDTAGKWENFFYKTIAQKF